MCDYCENENPFVTKKGWDVYIYDNEINVEWDGINIDLTINYCPMCGRKLSEVQDV